MIWLLRFAALLAAFYLLRELVRWLWRVGLRGLFASLERKRVPAVRHGTIKRDPVCGTYVDVEVSVQAQCAGEVLHFCSAAAATPTWRSSRPSRRGTRVEF